MPNVFIVQEPMRRDRQSGQLVPIMDFRGVLEYGDPVVCLNSPKVAFTPGPMIRTLKDVLKDFTDDDYLVAVGDPSAIAAAAAIAARNNLGRFNMLKWDKDSHKYIKVAIDTTI